MTDNQEIIDKVLELLNQGQSVTKISTTLNISKATIYKWRKKYQDSLLFLKEAVSTSKAINDLINTKDFMEALKLSEEPSFQDYYPIQSQRITILMKLQRYDEVLKLSEEPRFQKDVHIQSQRIAILMILNRYEEGLRLSKDPNFQDYYPIQSQRIAILIKLHRYKEALRLSEDPKFQNNCSIQSQRLTILIKLQRYDEALKLSEKLRFQKDFHIQSQRIAILIILKKYDYALRICEESRFQNYYPIQSQRKRILNLKQKSLQKTSSISCCNFNNIIAGIQNGSIASEDDIINLTIFEWQKVVLIVVFYEINNYPIQVVINYLKRQNAIYQNNPDVLQLLKKLLAHIKAKRRIFDIDFYQNLLKAKILLLPNEREYLQTLSENIINTKEEETTVGSR